MPAPQKLDPDIADSVGHVDSSRMGGDIATLVGFQTRNNCSTQTDPAAGIGAARTYIQQQFAAISGVQVMMDDYQLTNICTAGQTDEKNVVAWIPGSDPTRLIVLGGHYDSMGSLVNRTDPTIPAPGANDSGSQTALLLEAARVLALHPNYRATLVFAAFSGEEQGLFGSIHFAPEYRSIFAGATIEAMLDADVVGGDTAANTGDALQQFRLYAPGTPRETDNHVPELLRSPDDTSPSRGIMQQVGYWGGAYVPQMAMQIRARQDRPNRGGDHIPFLDNGIPAVRFIETNENPATQHNAMDTLANMTPAYTSRIAQVMIATAGSLARAPKAPAIASVSGMAGAPVTVSWTPAGGDVDHYVIGIRAAGEYLYQLRLLAPAGKTELQLTVGGDAFFVSVAAVDAAGHESLFAYPEWRCDGAGCAIQDGSTAVMATCALPNCP